MALGRSLHAIVSHLSETSSIAGLALLADAVHSAKLIEWGTCTPDRSTTSVILLGMAGISLTLPKVKG